MRVCVCASRILMATVMNLSDDMVPHSKQTSILQRAENTLKSFENNCFGPILMLKHSFYDKESVVMFTYSGTRQIVRNERHFGFQVLGANAQSAIIIIKKMCGGTIFCNRSRIKKLFGRTRVMPFYDCLFFHKNAFLKYSRNDSYHYYFFRGIGTSLKKMESF